MKPFFKKPIARFIAVFALGIFIFLAACKKENITKDLTAYLRTDVLFNPLSIMVVDANINNGDVPENMSISFFGPDADKIYSVLGQKTVKAEKNIINIGISKSDAPSITDPISFTMKVSATGYLTSMQNYVITDATVFRLEQISLIKKSSPPPGVSIATGNLQANGAQGTTQDFTLQTVPGNGDSEQLSLYIPAGTVMFEEGGTTPLSGNAEVTLVHLSSTAPEASALFPGGKLTGSSVQAFNGTQKKPARAEPAGCMSMKVQIGNTEVTTFSQPLTTTVSINNAIVNPEKGDAPLTAGDSLSIWRFDESKGFWQQESRAAVANDNGLEVSFEHTHLSWWFAGWLPEFECVFLPWENLDGSGVNAPTAQSFLTVNSDIEPDPVCLTGGGFFLTIVSDKKTGMTYYRGYEQFYKGRKIALQNWIPGTLTEGISVSIYGGSHCQSGDLLFQADLTNLCQDNTLEIGSALPHGLKINLEISGSCSGEVEIIPTLPVYYREAVPGGDPCFRLFGYVTKGIGCTGNIFKGKKYDFAVLYGNTQKYIYGITIPENDTEITVDDNEYGFKDTVKISFTGENQDELNFNFYKIGIPEVLCDEFKKYF